MSSKPLYYFSLFLWCGVLILILAGGLVTSKEAGLAVPDWPLSYGKFFPPMVGNVAWEHGHRMIAGTIGILTVILTFWIARAETRSWLKKLAWISLFAVVAQALLGGLTVKMLLPWPVSVLHACLAQTFFCIITAIAYFLSPYSAGHPERSEGSLAIDPSSATLPQDDSPAIKKLQRLSVLTAAFIFLQLVFGAMARHTDSMHVVITHIVWAVVVLVHITLVFRHIMNVNGAPLLRHAGLTMAYLVLIQVFLGLGSFIFTRLTERSYTPSLGEVVFTASHQTTGALILALSVLIAIIVRCK